MDVTAEGVETADQAAQLASLDCGFGQGFYFHRPLSPEHTRGLMATLFPTATLP